MLQIEIDIPRPWAFVWMGMGALLALFFWGGQSGMGNAPAEGGGGVASTVTAQVHEAESESRDVRVEQAVIARRVEILRYELQLLEQEVTADPERQDELERARAQLKHLLDDQRAGEQELLAALHQIREAQGIAEDASRTAAGQSGEIALDWPVEPALGISAYFEDEGYEQRFGMPHQAVDIPVDQGTIVRAAADGMVVSVNDHGLGFNSIVLKHDGGFATLYGHVSKFLVKEGDVIRSGDPIALSGGEPGTPGAGHLTTGPHLHFQLLKNGQPVDPLDYLPTYHGR